MSAFSSEDTLSCRTPSKSESVSEGHTKGQTHYCRVGARLVPPNSSQSQIGTLSSARNTCVSKSQSVGTGQWQSARLDLVQVIGAVMQSCQN